MIKAKVIKAFYYAKGKEVYLDEDRYNELKALGLVEEIKEIKSTDWSIITQTSENIITLITCIKNKPNLRLCVKAVEK